MKIVLHIGTHKTGTSALQSFCGLNRKTLLARDVLFPRQASRSNSFNNLPARIAFGKVDEVRRFFVATVREARRAGVGTILISSESCYAMTGFFYGLYNRPRGDYWEDEKRCVEALRTCLPENIDCSIYCYVRRQDRFLESLYNQCVKHWPGFDGDITDFLRRMREAMDYASHFDIWRNAFGDNALHVRSYEPIADRLLEDFLAWSLGLSEMKDFVPLGQRVNERLSRDLLEYKRILNRLELSRADGTTDMVQIVELAKTMGDNGRYHDYLSPDERQNLLQEFAESNALLVDRHPETGTLVQADLDLRSTAWTPYPGLSAEATVEIACRHHRLSRRPKERMQAFLRRVYYPLRLRYGLLDVALTGVRNLWRT